MRGAIDLTGSDSDDGRQSAPPMAAPAGAGVIDLTVSDSDGDSGGDRAMAPKRGRPHLPPPSRTTSDRRASQLGRPHSSPPPPRTTSDRRGSKRGRPPSSPPPPRTTSDRRAPKRNRDETDEDETDGDETETDGDETETDGDETETEGDETETEGDETELDTETDTDAEATVSRARAPRASTSRAPGAGPSTSRAPVSLRGYQERVVEHLARHDVRGLLVAHSTGKGKTLTALAAARRLIADKVVDRALIVVPKSLVGQWQAVARAYLGDAAAVEVLTHTHWTSNVVRQAAGAAKGKLIGCDTGAISAALSERYGRTLLVVDEAHLLRTSIKSNAENPEKKSDEGIGADALLAAAPYAARVLLMTATPLFNSPRDVQNALCAINGMRTAECMSFLRGVCGAKVEELESAQCAAALLDRKDFGRCRISREHRPQASDAGWRHEGEGNIPEDADFPRLVTHVVRIPMTTEYLDMYNKVEGATSAVVNGKDTSLKAFYNGLRRAANARLNLSEEGEMTIEADPRTNAKVKWLLDHVEEWAAEHRKRVLVYSEYKHAGIDTFVSLVRGRGIPCFRVTGDESAAARSAAVDEFNRTEGAVVAITGAGSAGLDLRGVERVVVYEPSWNMATLDQVVGRAVRFGSHASLPPDRRVVHAYMLLHVRQGGPGAMDEKMLNHARKKQDEIAEATRAIVASGIESGRCGPGDWP